jgi:ankyrin repeat protein
MVLLDRGSDPNASSEVEKNTPLHFAVRRRSEDTDTELLSLLLDRGADPYALNWLNATPLHEAVLNLNEVAVQFFIEYGLNPDLNQDDYQEPNKPLGFVGPPMVNALLSRSPSMVRLLIKLGASPCPDVRMPETYRATIEGGFWPYLGTENEMSFELRAELYAALGLEVPS